MHINNMDGSWEHGAHSPIQKASEFTLALVIFDGSSLETSNVINGSSEPWTLQTKVVKKYQTQLSWQ